MATLQELRERDRLAATARGPVGLGGWLILPMLGLILSPLYCFFIVKELFPILDGTLALTSAQTILIWFETILNVLLLGIAPIVILMLFFQQKRTFPIFHMAWMCGNLVFILVDLLVAYNLFRDYYDSPGVVFWDTETTQTLVRAAIGVAIWVPYMMNSARVRNTFVN
jgi:Protein of unknown function (DUF2569)